MALPWSTQAIADITNIGTTEQFSAEVLLDANQALTLDVAISAHPNDNVTIVGYEGQDGTRWAEKYRILIKAGATDPVLLGPIMLAERMRWGAYASGSTDLPTASFLANKGAVNSG